MFPLLGLGDTAGQELEKQLCNKGPEFSSFVFQAIVVIASRNVLHPRNHLETLNHKNVGDKCGSWGRGIKSWAFLGGEVLSPALGLPSAEKHVTPTCVYNEFITFPCEEERLWFTLEQKPEKLRVFEERYFN